MEKQYNSEYYNELNGLWFKVLNIVKSADMESICTPEYVHGWIKQYLDEHPVKHLKNWYDFQSCSDGEPNRHETFTYVFVMDNYEVLHYNIHYNGEGKLWHMSALDDKNMFVDYEMIKRGLLGYGYSIQTIVEYLLEQIKNSVHTRTYKTVENIAEAVGYSVEITAGYINELLQAEIIEMSGDLISINPKYIMRRSVED